MELRQEHDSVGSIAVPSHAYYGVHSQRAAVNFPMTGEKLHIEQIKALAIIKKAAALANVRAGVLDKRIADAIVHACDDILDGQLIDQFIVDPIQGGAGTSANMNANEVIANRAIEYLGGVKGDYSIVHPNDHVNKGQSTNDVYPTSGKLAALSLMTQAETPLRRLIAALEQKSREFDSLVKPGRTQLQDAVPIRLGQSFAAYAHAVERGLNRMIAVREELLSVNMGATAIGTTINAAPAYVDCIVPILSELTGLPLRQTDDLIDGTQHIDCFVPVSAAVKGCALILSKMSNDLRLLSSGPKTGFGEINLPARQNGSSIMPGKINPVIPEVVTQCYFRIAGNDSTIAMAAEAGQLELNAFEPVLFYSLFQSLELLIHAVDTLTDNCVSGITANPERLHQLIENSACSATALCSSIGYERAAQIVKQSLKTGLTLHDLTVQQLGISDDDADRILDPMPLTECQR